MATSQRGTGVRLTAAFWLCALATAALFYGANAPWFSVGGIELSGQDTAVRLVVSIDTVWIYAGAGAAAFALLIVVLFRARFAYALSAAAAAGTGGVLLSDYSDLRETLQIGSLAWGAYLTGAATLVLLVASVVGFTQGARP